MTASYRDGLVMNKKRSINYYRDICIGCYVTFTSQIRLRHSTHSNSFLILLPILPSSISAIFKIFDRFLFFLAFNDSLLFVFDRFLFFLEFHDSLLFMYSTFFASISFTEQYCFLNYQKSLKGFRRSDTIKEIIRSYKEPSYSTGTEI